jgi:hypothetical protein
MDKIKSEATWNEDFESWFVPELVIHKTKLPPAGKYIYMHDYNIVVMLHFIIFYQDQI